MSTPENALNDALRLAHYGRPAFPCRACANACMKCDICKKPACPHGFKDATTDPEKLRELWKQYPGELVGVPTGAASGLFVIDVDSGRHEEANDWLERWSPYLPETRQHATASGGWHLLFKHREGLRNSASKLARGVDTRGDGGYIIWWPFHLGLNAPHKNRGRLVELPDALYQQLIEAPKPAPISVIFNRNNTRHLGGPDARLDGLISRLNDAREGERNAVLYWCANRVCDMAREGELDTPATSRALQSLVSAAFKRGLTAKEIQSTVNSATRGRR